MLDLSENSLVQSESTFPKENIKTKLASLGLKFSESHNFSPKGKLIWSVLALLLVLVSVPVAIFLAKQKQEIRKEAATAIPARCYEVCTDDAFCNPDPAVQSSLVCGTGWLCDPTTQDCTQKRCYDPNCPSQTDCTCSIGITPTPTPTTPPIPARCYEVCTDDAFCNPEPTAQTLERLVCGCPPEQICSGLKCYNPRCPAESDCICPPNLPACNDVCKTDVDCLDPTQDTPNQMICHKPDWCDTGVCRNPQCPKIPDCDCANANKLKCVDLRAYTKEWEEITDFSTVSPGDSLNFLVKGLLTGSGEIDKAIFRVNDGEWLKPTGKKDSNFYLEYAIPENGHYKIEAMIHSPGAGWR